MTLEERIIKTYEEIKKGPLNWPIGELGQASNVWIGHGMWNGSFVSILPMHLLIEEAELAECLTSPVEYIRKYREWYEAQK